VGEWVYRNRKLLIIIAVLLVVLLISSAIFIEIKIYQLECEIQQKLGVDAYSEGMIRDGLRK